MTRGRIPVEELHPIEAHEIQRVLTLHRSGKSVQLIADEMNIPSWAVLLIVALYK